MSQRDQRPTEPVLTVAEVERRVEEIRAIATDDERAHEREKRLWEDVLESVAAGSPDSAALAAAALKTIDIDFGRWFA